MKLQIEELKGKSAFDLCRRLIHAGQDPTEVLEVYRGDTLSYTVPSLEIGARHRIVENDKVGPYVGKYRPMTEKDKERLKNRRNTLGTKVYLEHRTVDTYD